MMRRLFRVLWVLTAWMIGGCLPLSAHAVELTAQERSYLQHLGPVPFCVDPDWEPFEIINAHGEHEGIAADLLRLAAQRVGVQLQLVPTKDWDQSITASRDGRCKVLSFLNQTPKRDAWLLFTDPIYSDANVFITREEHPFIVDPAGLQGESIVLPTGTSIEERVRRDYPNLKVLLVPNEADAMELVSRRQASMTLRSLIMSAYTIRKEGLFNLKISGQLPDYANHLRIGVVTSEPLLRDILNKGVRSITPAERGAIVNRHIAINVQTAVDYVLTAKIAAVLVVGLVLVGLWGLQMRRHGRQMERQSQSDPLTGLPNRLRLNIQFPTEIERARRFRRDLSVILLDIDHFKRINDEQGHLTGDKVLVDLAGLIRSLVRATDLPCRWGGEEFLLLCPETSLEKARTLAERIRETVESHDFSLGHVQSISAGVAALDGDERIETLLQRADSALYAAKEGGRNRVCVA